MMIYLCIGLGGALGSMARFAMAGAVDRWTGAAFPWGTLLVNATGCFVIGFFATLTSPGGRWPVVPVPARHGFMAGVLGGFTTFSAFGLQTLTLAQAGRWWHAGGYAGASLALCLVAVWLGHAAAVAVNPARGA